MLFDAGAPVAGTVVSDGAAINMSSGRRVSVACPYQHYKNSHFQVTGHVDVDEWVPAACSSH